MKIESIGKSDLGLSRKVNEDCFFVSPDKQLFIVADGMGGHAAGEVASKLAVDAILKSLYPEEKSTPGGKEKTELVDPRKLRAEDRMEKAIQLANQRIFQKAAEKKSLEGMGTTVVAALVKDNFVIIAHVGDSRAYRLRDKRIEQLTDDHSLVAEKLKQRVMTKEEAEASQLKNVLTRALGSEETVKVDIQRQELKKGDCFFLSSDGLTGLVKPEEIKDIILKAEGNLELATDNLISLANERGGSDNITVVIFLIRELDEGSTNEKIRALRERSSTESPSTEVVSVSRSAFKVPAMKMPVKVTFVLVASTIIFLTITLSVVKFRARQRIRVKAERVRILAQEESRKSEEATALAEFEELRRQAKKSISDAKEAGADLYALAEWEEAGKAFRQAGDSSRDKDYQAATAQLTKAIEKSHQSRERASKAGKVALIMDKAGEEIGRAKEAGIDNYSKAFPLLKKAEEIFTQAELTFKTGEYEQSLKLAKEVMVQVKKTTALAAIEQQEKKTRIQKAERVASAVLSQARKFTSEAEKSGGAQYAQVPWTKARDLFQRSEKAFGQGKYRESAELAKESEKMSRKTIDSIKTQVRASIEKAEARFEQVKDVAKSYAYEKLTAARENLDQAKISLAVKDFPAAIRKSEKAFAFAGEAEKIAKGKIQAARKAALSWIPEVISYIDEILPRLSQAIEFIKGGNSSYAEVLLTEKLPNLFKKVIEVKGLPDETIKTVKEMKKNCKVREGWREKLPSLTILNEVRTTLQNLKERLRKEYRFNFRDSLNSL